MQSALIFLLALLAPAAPPSPAPAPRVVHVGLTPESQFSKIQQAIDSATENGLVILIAPGTYKEKLAINKPNIALVGTGKRPQDTIIAFNDSAKTTGSTFKSAPSP